MTKSNPMFWSWLGIIAISYCALMTGCSAFDFDGDEENLLDKIDKQSKKNPLLKKLLPKRNADQPLETQVQEKIRWDGDGIVLGEIETAAFSASEFLDTISELIKEQRHSTIRNLVKKYPDVAMTVLQEADPNQQNTDELQVIAREFDQIWCQGNRGVAWQTYLLDLTNSGRKQNSLLESKNSFWRYLKENEPKKALALNLVNRLPKQTDVVLSSEFYRLEAIAMMMNDQFDSAIKRLRQSVSLIERTCPYQAARLNLLLGEFYRHNGQIDLWKSAWTEAVTRQSSLAHSHGLKDPSFWSRAAYLRPADSKWPIDAIDNLRESLASNDIFVPENTPDDSIIWLMTGWQHNDRGEGQNAVLAFKKSEAATNDTQLKKQLQLFQARAMVLAGQPGAGSAILIRLISENQGKVLSDRAQAVLGAMKLQNGAIGQGINLIQSSMKSVDSWPQSERLRAQADYGLALLVSGKEPEGLKMLDQVQAEFVSIEDFGQVHQVLWNKATYFEKTDQKGRYTTATAEMKQIENRF